MQLQITLDGSEGADVARRVIAAVESLYDLSSTVSVRVGGDLRDTLASIATHQPANGLAIDPLAVGFGKDSAATIGFGETHAATDDASVNGGGEPLTPPATGIAGVEVDADGLPWDARIHSGGAKKNADGRWKAKRGVQDSMKATVESELRSIMAIPAPAAATTTSVPPPPPASEPAAAVVPPPPPPAAATEEPMTFAKLMGWIGPRMASQKLSPSSVSATMAALGIVDGQGVGQLAILAQRPDLVAGAYDALKAAAGE